MLDELIKNLKNRRKKKMTKLRWENEEFGIRLNIFVKF